MEDMHKPALLTKNRMSCDPPTLIDLNGLDAYVKAAREPVPGRVDVDEVMLIGQAIRDQPASQCLRLEFPRLLRFHPGLSPDVAHELKNCIQQAVVSHPAGPPSPRSIAPETRQDCHSCEQTRTAAGRAPRPARHPPGAGRRLGTCGARRGARGPATAKRVAGIQGPGRYRRRASRGVVRPGRYGVPL